MAKSIAKMTLGDVKHWIGWAITTGVLVGTFYYLPQSAMESIPLISAITLGIIVSVDVIKHYLNLQ